MSERESPFRHLRQRLAKHLVTPVDVAKWEEEGRCDCLERSLSCSVADPFAGHASTCPIRERRALYVWHDRSTFWGQATVARHGGGWLGLLVYLASFGRRGPGSERPW
jgi:hypothetical protein